MELAKAFRHGGLDPVQAGILLRELHVDLIEPRLEPRDSVFGDPPNSSEPGQDNRDHCQHASDIGADVPARPLRFGHLVPASVLTIILFVRLDYLVVDFVVAQSMMLRSLCSVVTLCRPTRIRPVDCKYSCPRRASLARAAGDAYARGWWRRC